MRRDSQQQWDAHQSPHQGYYGTHFPGTRGVDISEHAYYPPHELRHAQPASQFGVGKSLQKKMSYSINRRNTDDLKIFEGHIADFETRATKFSDHCALSCVRYRGLLERIRKSPRNFIKDGLMNSQVDGFNCWEVALELGGFTMKYLHSDLYESKFTLCGGEELNGFALWRNLELQYGGTGKYIDVSGLTKFMNYPQCKTENGLLKHLATWEEFLTKCGTELQQTLATLRVMLLNILPKEISDQLRPKIGKYPTSRISGVLP